MPIQGEKNPTANKQVDTVHAYLCQTTHSKDNPNSREFCDAKATSELSGQEEKWEKLSWRGGQPFTNYEFSK